MITYATLKIKPGVFKNLTGVSISEFDKAALENTVYPLSAQAIEDCRALRSWLSRLSTNKRVCFNFMILAATSLASAGV